MRNLASRLFGRARDLRDPKVFHQMSLVAFLAWVGLGADGLSSSAYGPEEAMKAVGAHRYLAVVIAIAIAATVFIISWGYRRIIEEFPHGGGGSIVPPKDLGTDLHTVGLGAIAVIFMRAFSLGGGTFTGIEAVSNGLAIMREPRVRTAKRTMLLMATSLAITAGGLMIAYLLFDVHPVEGK